MLKITHPDHGLTKVTFSLPADHPAGAVSVVGNFNSWTPGAHLLEKRSTGRMSAKVVVADSYEVKFRYLGTDGWWFDEPDADRVDAQGSVIYARPTRLSAPEKKSPTKPKPAKKAKPGAQAKKTK